MKNINSDFVSTEIDLDRDVPNTMGWDVDVDEDGPFITASFDDYCDAHPDFNDALNGKYKYDTNELPGFDSFLEKNLIA